MSEENKYTFENEEYRRTYWHTCSHVLAQAVKRLHPEVKLAIGPSIENGFYYDLDAPFAFTQDDLAEIEGELLNKQWYGIYIPAMDTSYDLNGDGINDVCVISGEAGNEPGVTYIVLDDSKYSLENGTTGRLLYTVGRNFEEKRYLRPIPKTALNINPDLGQNYYWR